MVAERCGLEARATGQLLGVLVSVNYLRFKKGSYRLTRITRKWILPDSPDTVRDLAIYNNRIVWPWLEKMGEYLKTGKGIQYHDTFQAEQWELYQRGMWAGAIAEAREFARKVPMPKTPRGCSTSAARTGCTRWSAAAAIPTLSPLF